jgi:hypothetical protein
MNRCCSYWLHRWRGLHSFGLQGLAAQSSVQGAHGRANLDDITTGIGGIQGFGRIDDSTVMVADGASRLWALCAFALESFVQRRTEDFPQFLFCFAV